MKFKPQLGSLWLFHKTHSVKCSRSILLVLLVQKKKLYQSKYWLAYGDLRRDFVNSQKPKLCSKLSWYVLKNLVRLVRNQSLVLTHNEYGVLWRRLRSVSKCHISITLSACSHKITQFRKNFTQQHCLQRFNWRWDTFTWCRLIYTTDTSLICWSI